MHVYIEDIGKHEGDEVVVKGWLHNRRSSGKIHFLILRDGTGFIQAVMSKAAVGEDAFKAADHLSQETSVIVTGTARADARAPGGRLAPILDTIRRLHAMGFWVEIVTLLIPGFNDSRDELQRLTSFIAGVSPDIPWHVTAFHGDYKMMDPPSTTPEMLLAAASIGRANGLRYVYAGNLPGQVGGLEDTRCAACDELLIARFGYQIRSYAITAEGCCPECAAPVP